MDGVPVYAHACNLRESEIDFPQVKWLKMKLLKTYILCTLRVLRVREICPVKLVELIRQVPPSYLENLRTLRLQAIWRRNSFLMQATCPPIIRVSTCDSPLD